MLRRSVDELGRTVVIVTHDPRVASYADRLVLLVDGKVAEDTAVQGEEQVLAAHALRLARAVLSLAIRNLFARKFRAISTASSVFFGVAMISGTLFISESVNRSFDNLFGEVNAGIDVTVREATVVDDPFDQGPQAGFEDSVLETVQDVEGVEAAEGVIADVRISILGDDGDRIGPPSGGPPHIALSTVETDEFDALTVVDGESPDAPDEVAIDDDSAEDEDFEVGDTRHDHG